MPCKIVPAVLGHINAMAELDRLCFPHDAWPLSTFYDQIQGDGRIGFCAVDEKGALIGFVLLMYVLDEAHIASMDVHPDFRRHGIAQALMEAALSWTEENGIRFFMLEVRASNSPAIALYAKNGFKTVGRRKNYYQSPTEDALLMTRL